MRRANKQRQHEEYANYTSNTYFDSRYPRRNRSSRALQLAQEYDDEPETFSPSPKSEDNGSETEEQPHNDENALRSPVRTRRSRRVIMEEVEDGMDDGNLIDEEEEISPPRKRRPRISDEQQAKTDSAHVNGLDEEENAEGAGDSLYERIKRRRQLKEDSAGPPAKRAFKQLGADKISDDSEQDDPVENGNEGRRYFFRRNRTQVTRLQDEFASAHRQSLRNKTGHGGRRSVRFGQGRHPPSRRYYSSSRRRGSSISSESSNTSDSDVADAARDLRAEMKFEKRKLRSLQKGRSRFLPINVSQKEWMQSQSLNQLTAKHTDTHSTGDIEPMGMDKTSFTQIGGLDEHIQSLKETVVFPLLYPELFERFEIRPPRGALFYGPPGTGKTLVARALANECSKEGRKVAFFMRKGADCLSKWVGESERQLRLLFDQAYQMRPSIIFFDEIDGLAPVRSSRQDQIHSSIVSTLLALMDGLDNRGQVVVIGATNRLDSLDPAIRRPGRFDRELRFDLPDKVGRESILRIHTSGWKEMQPNAQTLSSLAEKTSGYCGADLKALVCEAVLVAIRMSYPHMYISDEKLDLDIENLQVGKHHFEEALRRVIPASRRDFSASSFSTNHRLDVLIKPLVERTLQSMIPKGYLCRKPAISSGSDLQRVIDALRVPPSVPAARLILYGTEDLGQTRYFLNSFISNLDHLPIFTLSFGRLYANSQPEENLAGTILSITRATSRGTPALLILPDLDKLQETLPSSLWQMLLSSLNSFHSFTPLLVISSIQKPYEQCDDEIKQLFHERDAIEITPPTKALRRQYFQVLVDEALQQPLVFDPTKYTAPPKAKSHVQIRRMSDEELKNLEKQYEQMLRQFRIFLRDMLGRLIRDRRFSVFHLPVSVEDAEDYYNVIEKPLSLSEMMTKIDQKAYKSKAEFLADIKLIMDNALEYNPNNKMEDKVIRHNAMGLMDMAEALFDTEMDDEFEDRMTKTAQLVEEAKFSTSSRKDESPETSTVTPRRRKNSKQERGDSAEARPTSSPSKSDRKSIIVDRHRLEEVVEKAVTRTQDWSVQKLEYLGVRLVQEIQQYADTWDRSELPAKLMKEITQSR